MNKLFYLLALCFAVPSIATEVAIWDKAPIELRLEVGKERLVHVPSNVELNMPPTLRSQLELYNAAGTLYITPHEEFPKTRIKARLEDGELIFLDMFAVESENDDQLRDLKIIHQSQVEQTSKAFGLTKQEAKGVTAKQLFQYANIDLYGVPRLKPVLPITENELSVPLNLDLLFQHASAGLFELSPIKQYRSQNYTLTALKLKNRTLSERDIKLTHLYPSMIAALSHHLSVGPAGSLNDETTLFVLTQKPLGEYAIYSRMPKTEVETK